MRANKKGGERGVFIWRLRLEVHVIKGRGLGLSLCEGVHVASLLFSLPRILLPLASVLTGPVSADNIKLLLVYLFIYYYYFLILFIIIS